MDIIISIIIGICAGIYIRKNMSPRVKCMFSQGRWISQKEWDEA